ncbi:hypothetical protein [Deinococcus humi]|uniref:Low temperature-induced protein n=1 Tax=Deinococcus humi TaxID=662880 RepID=A0A7W8NCU1_9DEIO|nr:hypothetical protein [Deinococcus humi]MBB5361666.1 hypothetical protein [Deinococcus humi]GGO24317.1 hypothetical protein GCM10008949_13300 [Deinococcus humi]
MKHILFPTTSQADAFIAELQEKGVVAPTMGTSTYGRHSDIRTSDNGMDNTTTAGGDVRTYDNTDNDGSSAAAEDAGAGAVKGTGVGAVVGAGAGLLGTAGTVAGVGATVATGGLAIPVVLGMAALGAGVGAAVGAAGGAAGVDENHDGRTADSDYGTYGVSDDYYDRMHSTMNAGGRAVAVEDAVPYDVVAEAVQRHGGEFVDENTMDSRRM